MFAGYKIPDIYILLSISLSHAPSLNSSPTLLLFPLLFLSLSRAPSLTLLLFLSLVMLHSLNLAIAKLKEARRFLHYQDQEQGNGGKN
ncbi:hypothetical protein P8452_28393 [Trifolium repens]|nr:hypothetical protein P8452_28393 [Trifolium repens]